MGAPRAGAGGEEGVPVLGPPLPGALLPAVVPPGIGLLPEAPPPEA